MRYLLDSDTCIFAIRSNKPLLRRLASVEPGHWAISAVTAFEIAKGIELHPGTRARFASEQFLETAQVLEVTADVAIAAAKVHAYLKALGRPAGIADELIASQAIHSKMTLVTNNTKHFENVPGLKLENWL
jgi:tRNA(fMet)-specific endonuclease VapC